MSAGDDVLPAWLRPVVDACAEITVDELTRFVPPEDGDARRGAVLMLFADTDADGEGELLLTERAHHMRSHPGQVSFPGGTIDPGETAVEAALREAEEEIALDPTSIEVFGELPELWLPPSNFAVTPVLGWWREPSPLDTVDPTEVHRAVRAPLADLLDPAARFTVSHPSGYRGPGFEFDGLFVWGFTAGLLSAVLDFGGLTVPWDRSVERPLPARYRPGGSQDALTRTATEGRA